MLNIEELLKNIKIEVKVVVPDEDDVIESDFQVGDRVIVCHKDKNNGDTRHTVGTVDSIGTDDVGNYVRVTGDNGKHYKCGVKMDEERLGSKIFAFVD